MHPETGPIGPADRLPVGLQSYLTRPVAASSPPPPSPDSPRCNATRLEVWEAPRGCDQTISDARVIYQRGQATVCSILDANMPASQQIRICISCHCEEGPVSPSRKTFFPGVAAKSGLAESWLGGESFVCLFLALGASLGPKLVLAIYLGIA